MLLVRDDFWMLATRLFKELDTPLVDGQNAAAVDLFDPIHARKVLAEFGKAYGRLPENLGLLSRDQDSFLTQSVTGLSPDGKVNSIRLALFSDMMKSRPWTPAALAEVGGTTGVGATFLEETFSSRTAPPKHRQHQNAAQDVLRALLPSPGINIKGQKRTASELQEVCGYAGRPQDFAELMSILDSEVRLITPVGSENVEGGVEKPGEHTSLSVFSTHTSHFQLTHDYLVPSLREWLTRKQRETRRGKAELRLQELAATWTSKPDPRFLPSLWEYLDIRMLTKWRNWSSSERVMMARATGFHAWRSTLAALAIIGLLAFSQTVRNNIEKHQEMTRIGGLVGQLIDADPNQIPEIVARLAENSVISDILLSPLLTTDAKTVDQQRAQLHARLASVARDSSLVEGLQKELLTCKVTYIHPIREMLKPYASQLTDAYWRLLRDETVPADSRFAAALALADYVPESETGTWTESQLTFVADQLVSANAEYQPTLRKLLLPIHAMLLPNLELIFKNASKSEAQRLSAANAFADYAARDIDKLTELLTIANDDQYAVLYPIVAAIPAPSTVEDLREIAATPPPKELGSVDRIYFGQRRANAAVTMLRLGEPERMLPVFDWKDDPEALTQFIFRCKPRGIGVSQLLDLLEFVATVPDNYPQDTRYALLLAIGEFRPSEIPSTRRATLVNQLALWYANDPSSGMHGAAGWLLRHLGENEIVTKVDQTPVPYSPDRQWFTLAITVTPSVPTQQKQEPAKNQKENEAGIASTEKAVATEKDAGEVSLAPKLTRKTFYYTFIVFPAGSYDIGSPADEPERSEPVSRELHHFVKLSRPFALLDREITNEELIAFIPTYFSSMQRYKAQPAEGGFGADWYDAVAFCRWLGGQAGLSESEQPYPSPESLNLVKYPHEPAPEANWAPRNWPVDLDRRGFRLPTEAEWEVAARGGSRTAYGFGGDALLLTKFAWFKENSGKQVHPTKLLRPSIRGLFDLHGNLWELTHDWDKGYRLDAVTDPIVSTMGALRVIRGGSWNSDPALCRAAFRNSRPPPIRALFDGFQIALSPSEIPE